MSEIELTRRAALLGLAGSAAFARTVSAAPAAEAVTDALAAAANKEGTVVFHSSMDLAADSDDPDSDSD